MPQIDDSSMISRVDWANGVLEIEFKNGSTYRGHDIPSGIFNEMLAAESKGRFFNENIKGQFEVSKVTPDE